VTPSSRTRRNVSAGWKCSIKETDAPANSGSPSATLRPKASAVVWRQIRERVGVPGKRLEVVVELATLAASLVRSDAELGAALPRGQEVIVIDLGARCARARERYRQFLAGSKHIPASAGPRAEARNAL